ncbi:MAG: ABC-2 family transporter protein [Chloroflexi bacterium]|nr:ABC-2 family transporter protein [Chloroflexota bacterium]
MGMPARRAGAGLELYRVLALAQLRAQMQYRGSFLLQGLAVFLGTIVDFIGIAFLFARFESIGGWRLPDVALLYGLVNLPFATVHLLAEGFEDFQQLIRPGSLDQLLLRPRSVFVQVLGSKLPLRQLGRLASASLVMGLALHWLEAPRIWTPGDWLYLAWSLAGGGLFFLGMVMLSASACFWTVESIEVANIVTYGGTEMASYPMHIFGTWLRRLFTYLLPLAFVSYYPALRLLDKPDPLGLPAAMAWLAVPVCAATLAAGFGAWRLGLRHYQSTGH